MAIVNRIITRGFGASRTVPGRAGPVTLGYGGPPSPTPIVEAIADEVVRRKKGNGRPLDRSQIEYVTVWAKLVEANGQEPKRRIEGSVRVPVTDSYVRVVSEHLTTRVANAWEKIKVTVKRIKD